MTVEGISDYTEWQRKYYDAKTPDEIRDGIRASSEEYTFHGKKRKSYRNMTENAISEIDGR